MHPADPNRQFILGVPFDAVTRVEAVRRCAAMLDEPRGHFLTTPNAEMLVAAHSDAAFRAALRDSDLALADGSGPVIVGRLLGKHIPERITGTDFVEHLTALAAARGKSVFLLGGEGERVAERAAAKLSERYPGLHVAGTASGFKVFWEDPVTPVIDGKTLVTLKAAAPDILFVALGHRKQELWIRQMLSSLPSVRIAIGVGGAFDFIAGDIRRAPVWMRYLGLEWLWRLILEPKKRLRRIWRAVFVFPWLAFKAEK